MVSTNFTIPILTAPWGFFHFCSLSIWMQINRHIFFPCLKMNSWKFFGRAEDPKKLCSNALKTDVCVISPKLLAAIRMKKRL